VIIHNLFPIPIGSFQLDREFTQGELDFINGQETRPNQGNVTSKDNNLFDRKELKDLACQVQCIINEYFDAIYKPKHDVKLYVTQSWANYTKPGEYHHKHAHPNSFVSGVLYINSDPEKDKIYFYRDGYQQLKLPPSEWNLYNSESWWFEVKPGQIYLFPSSTTHMVQTTESADTRVSIAFNTFLKGYIGEDVDLTGLHL
jgi:uncharacterized protein (TIGR02466 family)